MGQPDNILRFGHPPSRIDVMTTVSGLDFRDAESRIQCFTAGDVSIPCICLADLLENKRASARPKDLVDVATLETLP